MGRVLAVVQLDARKTHCRGSFLLCERLVLAGHVMYYLFSNKKLMGVIKYNYRTNCFLYFLPFNESDCRTRFSFGFLRR